MLFHLRSTDARLNRIEALPFKDFSGLGHQEKDLEHLIACNLLDVLFEDASLMPIFQERAFQAEADVYALNRQGDLTIFELKLRNAGQEAVHQALRYAQDAGRWGHARLEQMFRSYTRSEADLIAAHKEAFDLEHAIDRKELNTRQHLMIIGSAADEGLVSAVDYWRRQGVSIGFLPYRIFELHGEPYFEFFAPPYDRHRNPAESKGVLFDTNRSYDEDAIWYMFENRCVAAFGDAKRFVEHIHPGDIVFLSHRWVGVVAAARVKRGPVRSPDDDTQYRDVEFITPLPVRGQSVKGMPFAMVSEATGKSFFWARTIKVPYLSRDEAEGLAASLLTYLGAA